MISQLYTDLFTYTCPESSTFRTSHVRHRNIKQKKPKTSRNQLAVGVLQDNSKFPTSQISSRKAQWTLPAPLRSNKDKERSYLKRDKRVHSFYNFVVLYETLSARLFKSTFRETWSLACFNQSFFWLRASYLLGYYIGHIPEY